MFFLFSENFFSPMRLIWTLIPEVIEVVQKTDSQFSIWTLSLSLSLLLIPHIWSIRENQINIHVYNMILWMNKNVMHTYKYDWCTTWGKQSQINIFESDNRNQWSLGCEHGFVRFIFIWKPKGFFSQSWSLFIVHDL